MNKYRVKVIQLSLRNNKLANSGELVTESQLNGNAAELVKQGFIEKYVDEAAAELEAEALRALEKAYAKEAFDKAYEEGSLDADQLDSITMKEIYAYAQKHSFKYDDDAKKAELIEQVLKAEIVEE